MNPVNPLREWAWQQYNKAARFHPNSDQSHSAWKIHLAAIDLEARMKAPTPARKAKREQKQLVISISDMDTATFAIHFTRRHADSLAGQESLPERMEFSVEQNYRAFHRRLHGTRDDFPHEHEPESAESEVDRAIQCLIDNRNFGWKEIAGLDGNHVAVFPDGQIATRVNGKVKHHDSIESATDRIVG